MHTLDRLEQLSHWSLVARLRVGLLCFLAANVLLFIAICLFGTIPEAGILNKSAADRLAQLVSLGSLSTTALILASFRIERASPDSPLFAAISAVFLAICSTLIFIFLGIFSSFAWAAMIAVATFGFTVFDKRFVWSILGTILCGLVIYTALLVTGIVEYHDLLGQDPTTRENLGYWALFQWSTTGVAGTFSVWFTGVLLGKWHAREGALQLESETDALTELLNRRSFFRRCADLLAHPSKADQPISVALFDLDHFKAVNDCHGHDAGDATLVEVARTIQSVVRDDDIVARFGGEEIVVVLPGCDLEKACSILERCRQAISALLIRVPDEQEGFSVTTSIGVTSIPNYSHESIEDLIKRADEALYRAKDSGRNRIVVWEE